MWPSAVIWDHDLFFDDDDDVDSPVGGGSSAPAPMDPPDSSWLEKVEERSDLMDLLAPDDEPDVSASPPDPPDGWSE